MTPAFLLKRLWRERRSFAMLLLAICLLTGFFALGPLYIRAVTEAGLRFELDHAAPEETQIQIMLDNDSLSPAAMDVVSQELGDLAVSYRYYMRANYTPPQTQGGIDVGGLATSGYLFRYGQPVSAATPRSDHAYQPFAFANMEDLLTLVAGRWPQRLPPPSAVSTAGVSDAEQQARQIGIYTRGEVEVVITATVARRAGIEPGDRVRLGTLQPDGGGALVAVVVVGIVEPTHPLDSFWQGNRLFTEGLDVPVDMSTTRYDFGIATVPSAYTDWLQAVTPGSRTIYLIETNPDVISASEIKAITGRLKLLGSRLSAYHPGVTVLTGLGSILERYTGDVDDTQGPITLLSGAILVLMLYHLVSTVTLVLEQQEPEWRALISRGASLPQLVMMQVISVGLVGLVGSAAGPLLSLAFMELLERFGPLAAALDGRTLGSMGLPSLSLILSGAAGLAAVVALTLPAFAAARHSQQRIQRQFSRPPTRPAWARYGLDGVLLIAGGALLLRLYYLVGGDFGGLLADLVTAPRDVVALVADNLTDTGGLNDPFNVLAPGLVLTGAALAWLRLFPRLMALVARWVQRDNRLTTPLACWHVARDPGHYAQVVLLLIGTLALGTASLGLTATRDRGAWRAARDETGGSARVTLNPALLSADDVYWTRLPGVATALSLMHVTADPGAATTKDVHLFGVDPAHVRAQSPGLAAVIAPLAASTSPIPPGLELPVGATTLAVQVYSLPSARANAPGVTVQMNAYIQDARGVPFRIRLAELGADSATPTGRWLTLEGPMPVSGRAPFRLMRLGLTSQQPDEDTLQHTLYLDHIATRDVMGTATTIESFETPDHDWAPATSANPYAALGATDYNAGSVAGATITRLSGASDAVASYVDGPGMLRIDYWIGRFGGRQNEPSITVDPPAVERVPVIVNRTFAALFAGTGAYRTAADKPLVVGDAKNITLTISTGSATISYQIVGIIDDFPSVSAKNPVMIAPLDRIEPVINQAATAATFYTANEIWLDLPAREPSADLRAALADLGDGVENVTYAWQRYGEIQREPLPSAVAGMLLAGFWVSLLLSLLDFAFYLAVTARQRLYSFAVLRSLGWNTGHLWYLLLVEQIALVTPALVAGSLIGAGLSYLLLPFLALAGEETLRIPWLNVVGLLGVLVMSFAALMGLTAIYLRRMSINQALRRGEE